MTDAHKQLSIADLELPAKRGRPKSGNALSNSEKQKQYRERLKDRGSKNVLFEPFEATLIDSLLIERLNSLSDSDPMRSTYVKIGLKLGALIDMPLEVHRALDKYKVND